MSDAVLLPYSASNDPVRCPYSVCNDPSHAILYLYIISNKLVYYCRNVNSHPLRSGILTGISTGILVTPCFVVYAPDCGKHNPECVRRSLIYVPNPQHPRFSVSKQNNRNTTYIPFCSPCRLVGLAFPNPIERYLGPGKPTILF